MLDRLVTLGGTFVSLMDGDGAEHVVPVQQGLTDEEAYLQASTKLAGWKADGRAQYTEPLRPKGNKDA